jgi:hypothetical protein
MDFLGHVWAAGFEEDGTEVVRLFVEMFGI